MVILSWGSSFDKTATKSPSTSVTANKYIIWKKRSKVTQSRPCILNSGTTPLFYELCSEIWGESPAMESIQAGLEIGKP